jgi:tetratricopeptide (TPR) repeat protein
MDSKRFSEAAKAYDSALQNKPGDGAAIAGKRAALDALKPPPPKPAPKPAPPAAKPPAPKPAANPQSDYPKSIQQASALEKQRKYGEAVAAYRKALGQAQGDSAREAQSWLGVARNEHLARHFAEAVKAYQEVLKRSPNQPEAKAALPRAKAGKP